MIPTLLFIFIASLTTFIFVCASQCLVRKFVGGLYEDIEKTAKKFKYNEKLTEKTKQQLIEFAASSYEDNQKQLGFITRSISIIEYLVFGFLLVFFLGIINLNDGLMRGLEEVLIKYGTFLGAWLGIKTLGNYGQWSNPILGRAFYYVFMLGTLLNIALSVVLALFLYFLSKL